MSTNASPIAHGLLSLFALSLACGDSAAQAETQLRAAPAVTRSPRAKVAHPPVSPSEALHKADKVAGEQQVMGVLQLLPGAGDAEQNKTLAPYFRVPGDDDGTEALPLKETRADVKIAGVIAQVTVHQVFENGGAKPIEAVYVFPASTRAAVHGMRMKIGERTIEASIDRRAKARADYEAAKEAGQRASLLEQERTNVFTMNVANIMPGDRIEVTLDYSELLVPEDGVYEFVYPTVVGPRYGGGADPAKDRWIANPFLHEGESEPYKFGIAAHLETGVALRDLNSPSHAIDIAYASASSADVKLGQTGGGNKDFVLRYRLAGDQIDSGLLLHETDGEKFFLLMLEPPVSPSAAELPPREYVFVLDVSGSMGGYPLETAKVLLRDLLGQLGARDEFNIVLFSGTSYVMSPTGSIAASELNIGRAISIIDNQRGGGGTELMGSLTAAYAIPRSQREVSRTVVVVTDGYVGVEAKAFKFIRDNLNQANLFAFGIGSSVNRGLIEGMARAGMGEPFVVLGPDKAKAEAEKLRRYIRQPVLSRIQVAFDGFDAHEVAPESVPDLMARRPLVVFGKYRGAAKGSIRVSGFTGGGAWTRTIDVGPAAVKPEHAPLRTLWARKWTERLTDAWTLTGGKEVEDAITNLGLGYALLTPFTSFIAIDSEVVNQGGRGGTVNQPLPLPEGVSNQAVGTLGPNSGGGGRGPATRHGAPRPAPMKSEHRSRESGRGYGGTPAAATPVAPSATTTAATAEHLTGGVVLEPSEDESRDARSLNDKDAGDVGGKRPDAQRGLSASITSVTGQHITASGDLSRDVTRAIVAAIRGCSAAADGSYRVRLTVDTSGRVIAVELLAAADATTGACLKLALAGLTVNARASGAATGTLELELRIGRR